MNDVTFALGVFTIGFAFGTASGIGWGFAAAFMSAAKGTLTTKRIEIARVDARRPTLVQPDMDGE